MTTISKEKYKLIRSYEHPLECNEICNLHPFVDMQTLARSLEELAQLNEKYWMNLRDVYKCHLPTAVRDVFMQELKLGINNQIVISHAFVKSFLQHNLGRGLSEGFRKWFIKSNPQLIIPQHMLDSFDAALDVCEIDK